MNDENILVYEVIPTNRFNDNVKYYIRKKHFITIQDDIEDILDSLEKGIFLGDKIPGLILLDGKSVYKARAGNSDTNVGKSNGYRIIYYVEEQDKIIFLVTIYYKKEKNRIPTNTQIGEFIQEIIHKYGL